jgi:hypothetical protein
VSVAPYLKMRCALSHVPTGLFILLLDRTLIKRHPVLCVRVLVHLSLFLVATSLRNHGIPR